MWVAEGLCPRGCEYWWEPAGLRVLGAPQGSETPLAALGELGAAVGSSDWVGDFLKQAFEGYRTFTSRVVAATLTADRHWSRAQAGAGLLRTCALPRLLHLFRALSPEAIEKFAEEADTTSRAAYEQVLTAKLTTTSQQKRLCRLAWGGAECRASRICGRKLGLGLGSERSRLSGRWPAPG